MKYDRENIGIGVRQAANFVFVTALGGLFAKAFDVGPLIPIVVAFLWLRPDKQSAAAHYRSLSLWVVLLLLLLVCVLMQLKLE